MANRDNGDFREANRSHLVDLLASRFSGERRIGLKLEHILVQKNSLAPVSYSGEHGMHAVLEGLAGGYEEKIIEEGNLVGLSRPGESITLEPGGQLMLSMSPFDDVDGIEKSYLDFRLRLFHVLERLGLHAPMVGYHPTARASELEVAPNPRYERIADLLSSQSPYGVPMMRGTAALQVSLDCKDEADAVRKLRIASALAPILSLITDNAPVFEGEPRKMQMARMHAWMSMEQDRVGTVPGIMDPGFTLARYADYILTRQAVYVREADGTIRSASNATFDELYGHREMSCAALDHALSMVWTDARLGDGVEIRAADAMPFDYTLAYTAFIDRLFHDDRALSLLDTMFDGVTEEDIVAAKTSLIERGYGGQVYGKSASFWTDSLIVLATGGPDQFDMFRYIEPLFSMTKARLTLAGTWDGEESGVAERRTESSDVAVRSGAPVIGVLPHYDFESGDLLVREGVSSGVLAAGGLPLVLPRTDSTFLMWRILETCDAILFVGGHDIDPNSYGELRHVHQMRSIPKRDIREIALARAAIEMGKPILGICRGMQVINVAYGGSLHADISACAPDTELEHMMNPPFNHPAHSVAVAPGTHLREIVGTDSIEVNSMHHQCVGKLGEGLRICAKAPDGVVEGIEDPEGFILGVQWHPEHMWRVDEHAFALFKAFVAAASK
ncbi:MAG: glutamate-cysteine ligase family protein [Coriobacteriales bacterium]